MIIKVPIYVDIDTTSYADSLIPEVQSLLNEVVTEHLKAKLPESKRTLKGTDDNGDKTTTRVWTVVTREEAINSFR
jgi:hypothetical protein